MAILNRLRGNPWALFTTASAFCWFAQDPAQLIIARALQGVGGAMMSPQPMAIITGIFPPELRDRFVDGFSRAVERLKPGAQPKETERQFGKEAA